MARKPLEVPMAIPVPDDLPLSVWLEDVKRASAELRVPLPRRQAAAVRKIKAGLEHQGPGQGTGR